jgi:uncharacterized repeat protein (TIGR01451 family)
MRRIHRNRGRHRKPGPRFGRVAFVVSLALVISQSLGIIAASAGNPSADLDQCANGSLSSPNVPACNPDEWVNGNLGASKAHYFEGDSIPYRMKFDNLATTGTHEVIIEWDTTEGGKHAIDYLTSFDRTVATANPCVGVSPCGSPTTFPIPADPQVTAATVAQIPGNFTLYGGTITGVSAYSYPKGSGFSGNKSARITITFTASQANPVLAWGGHISTRSDWGLDNSAVGIPGSPYHMRLIDLDGAGGNQDRSLSEAAVIFPGSITIVKDAQPNDPQDFSYTTTGGLTPPSFLLDDDANGTLSNTQAYLGITNFTTYTVTEGSVADWTLSFGNPVCTVTSSNGGTQTGDVGTRTVTISLKEGENVTCTYVNTQVVHPTISITKVADAGTVNAGSTIGFVITATAGGTGTANDVTVTDTLPTNAGLSWSIVTADTTGGWTCGISSGVLTCGGSGFNLASGSSASVHITSPTTADTCGQVTNTASVGSTNAGGDSREASITVNCPSISITKVADASPVNAGSTIGFVITATAGGTGTANGVTVSDNLPDTGLNWSIDAGGSDSGCSISGAVGSQVLTCNFGTLASGSSKHVHITSPTTTANCGQVPNSASVSTTNEGSGNVGPVSVTVVCPTPAGGGGGGPTPAGIQVVKDGPAVAHVGDTITYTFAVSLAPGSATLTNITLVDPICIATPTLESKTGGDQDTALETGETWNYSCKHLVTATDPDPLPNTVTVTGTGPNGQVSDTDTHSVDIIHPAIRIVKTANPGSIGPGETVTYTYKVTNTGDVTLFDVKVTDNKLGNICTIAQLDVGETKTCTADFTASSDFGGPVDNVGKARGHDVTGVSVQDTDQESIDVVLGTTVTPVTPPSSLAFTGSSGVLQMAGVALLLLLLGTGILFFTRRREDGTEA